MFNIYQQVRVNSETKMNSEGMPDLCTIVTMCSIVTIVPITQKKENIAAGAKEEGIFVKH